MFEYNYDENKIISRDPKHHPDHEAKENYKYERMWVAKSFSLMQSLYNNNYQNIYCGATDMDPRGFTGKESISGDSSAYHESASNNDLPTQTDQ